MTISKRYIEADGHKFYKLTPYDRAEIAEAVRKDRRAKLEASLASVKDEAQRTVEMERFDDEFPRRPILREYICTDAGQLDVFTRALRRDLSEDKAKEVLRDFSPDEDEAFELAAGLAGVKLSA